MVDNASRTSSNLKGFMTAVTNFMAPSEETVNTDGD
jgi:hypothetical protein